MTGKTPKQAASDGPRYAQVASDLRAAIRRGDYSGNAQMPTESVLCATYGVSRFTVREALRQLQTEGLIRRRRGSGTVVEPDGGDSLRQQFSQVGDLLQYAAGSTFDFESRGLVTLATRQALDLALEAGERWYVFEGLRTMVGHRRPIALTRTYVHRDLAEFVPQVRRGTETIFRQVERLSGIHIARVSQDIQAIIASAADADALMIPRRAPCLRILRTYFDSDRRVFELSSSIHPGDLFTYSMQIEADS